MRLRHKLLQYRIVRFFSSVKLAVVCLILLFLLTAGGTIAQIQDGLYLAQQRYFESFFFLAFGFLPFPGAQAVMWVLFANLVTVAFTRYSYQWRRVGILIIHGGLLLFFISAYITLHAARESHLTLAEGQAANYAVSYHNWEIAVWEPPATKDPLLADLKITAFDADQLKPQQTVNLADLNLRFTVKQYYKNCDAFASTEAKIALNTSGISRLEPVPLLKEPEKNRPGGTFTVRASPDEAYDIILYGGEAQPTTISMGNKSYNVILRLKHQPLPFTLKLKDFRKEEHPGTDTARSFQSLVEIRIDQAWREKLISMNEPLRYNEFTLYQASFSVDQMGQEFSTLAVVKNAGRLMPYISTFVTFFGLVTHFGMMAFFAKKRKA